MKLFLLTAGDQYYPRSGSSDWIGFFETYEEAKAKVIGTTKPYIIDGTDYDWYDIIDLETYIMCQDFKNS